MNSELKKMSFGYFIVIFLMLTIGCAAQKKQFFRSAAEENFSVKASSTRNVSDRPYVLFEREVEGSDDFKIALRFYVAYVLNYQGYEEAIESDPDAIYVSYDFGVSNTSEKERCLDLTAFSKRVYDSSHRVVPIWVVNSCHQGQQSDVLALLPMFALSIRDVTGKSSSLYQSNRSYPADDAVVKSIADEIKPTLQLFKEK